MHYKLPFLFFFSFFLFFPQCFVIVSHNSVKSPQRCLKMAQPHVEAGSNTFTVALRVVGGYEKGTQCLVV
jgi:hypothetical protein